MTPPTARAGADRCPGALTPFAAEDGLIVRARVPGGEVPVAVLAELLAIGAEYGTPRVQLTTRANLQVRGLPSSLPPQVAHRIAGAGLLPSPSHERARNIIAAPTSARLRARARELDRLLCGRPALAALPGRFLMLLTDESGLGLAEPYDLAYLERPGRDGLLLAGGRARAVSDDAALPAMLRIAEAFLQHRADERQWNLRDLPDTAGVLDGFAATMEIPAPSSLPPGPVGDDLVAAVPLGLLDAEHLRTLAKHTEQVVLTPWRSLLIPGAAADPAELQAAGLVTDPRSTWARLSACTGAPYCARATSETMNFAREIAAQLPASGPRLHLVGCERRCGAPRGEHVSVVGARSVNEVQAAVASCP